MKKLVTTPSVPQTDAECEAVLAQLLMEMQGFNEQMRRDQADIYRIKAETDTLKAETQRLKAETPKVLARLGAAL